MGLATAALVRGDGEWENIQEVLRSAFLAHDEQLLAQAKRLDVSEQRSAELSVVCAANTESLVKFQGLRGHVDALARVVNTLSEELKQRAQDEQERRQQLKTWMESITRTVETPVNSAHDRIGGVETTLDKMQRRMELVEEELGHFVDALERKADVQVFQSHKKAVEEALKLRCRKAAFDKEVQRVHQLLRTQMSTTTERLELMRSELTEQLQKQQLNVEKQTQTHEGETTRRLCEDLRGEIEGIRQDTLATCGDLMAAARTELRQRVEEALGAHGEPVAKQSEDIDALKLQVEQVQSELEERRPQAGSEVAEKINELRECVEPRLAQLEQWRDVETEQSGRLHEAWPKLKEELAVLQSKLEEVALRQTQTTESLALERHDVETRQTELAEELREGWRAREKKMRQQMHLVADKLGEMDQILKLVGKQLVQNTSQLQLLWCEPGEIEDGEMAAPMIADGEAVVAHSSATETADAIDHTADAAHAEEVATRRISQHQQLQESIEAKLRDYEEILLLQKQTAASPPEAT